MSSKLDLRQYSGQIVPTGLRRELSRALKPFAELRINLTPLIPLSSGEGKKERGAPPLLDTPSVPSE